MKLLCVGVGPCRCLVLRYRKANILLDCALPLHGSLCALSGGEGPASSAAGGNGDAGVGVGEGLWDLTPFLQLLHTLELHAALISSAEALLALPYLLAPPPSPPPPPAPPAQPPAPDSTPAALLPTPPPPGQQPPTNAPRTARTAAPDQAPPAPPAPPAAPLHHLGPIRGPIYATQAALDVAEQLAAERQAAAAAVAAEGRAGAAGHSRRAAKGNNEGNSSSSCSSSSIRGGWVPPCAQQLGLHVRSDQEPLLAAACWRRRDGGAAERAAVRACLDRVRPVRYGQVVSVDGYELTAVPYPAGSGFGHAVWQIMDGPQRCRTVLYLPHASPSHAFAAPLPLEGLLRPDCLILGPDMLQQGQGPAQGPGQGPGKGQGPGQPPQLAPQQPGTVQQGSHGQPGSTHPEQQPGQQGQLPLQPCSAQAAPPPLLLPAAPPRAGPMQRVKELVLHAVLAGGCALLPVHATGTAWELVEALAGALAGADLLHVPLLHVGPRSRTSLALGAVSMEALCPARQAAVYLPDHPFEFNRLMQAGRLVTASSLSDPVVQRLLLHQQQQQQEQQPPGPGAGAAGAAGGGAPAVLLLAADMLPTAEGRALLGAMGRGPANVLVVPDAAAPAALSRLRQLCAAAVAAAASPGPACSLLEVQPGTEGVVPAAAGGGGGGVSGGGCGGAAAGAAAGGGGGGGAGGPLLRMRVAHVPLHGSGSWCGPTPQQLLELLSRLQPHNLLLSGRDLRLLELAQQAAQQQAGLPLASPPPLARGSVVPYSWLHRVRLPLPRNTSPALVSTELLNKLHWLSVGPDVQVARFNCILAHRDGCWHADPVPGSGHSADAVAAGAAFAAGGAAWADQLLLGRPALAGVLQALRERHGVTRVTVTAEGEDTRVALDGTDAHVLLRPHGAHVATASPALRHVLTDALLRQLTVL